MRLRISQIILVQIITITRIIATFTFIILAFIPEFKTSVLIIYLYAIISDFIDGYLAKRMEVSSKGGQTLDILGDQYLTIVSAIYLIFINISLLPCLLIIFREILFLSFRKFPLLFPPKRLVGGILAGSIWLATLISLVGVINITILNFYFWFLSLIVMADLVNRIIVNWKNIKELFVTN